MSVLNFANNYVTTLQSNLDNVTTTFSVDSVSGVPTAPFVLVMDRELMLVTAVAGSTFTLPTNGRGWEGSVATSHQAGASLAAVWSVRGLQSLAAGDSLNTGFAPAGVGYWSAYAPSGLSGATTLSRYVGGTVSGAPLSGAFAMGDFVVTQDGTVCVCYAAGTPGSWSVMGKNNYRASVHASASQFGTGGPYVLRNLDVKDYDPNNNFDTGAHAYTCPVSGVYEVSAFAPAPNAVTGDYGVAVFRNGGLTRELGRLTTSGTGGNNGPSGTAKVICNALDTLAIFTRTPDANPDRQFAGAWADFTLLTR